MEDELSYLLDKGMRLSPDVIVLAFCENDFYDYDKFWRSSFKRSSAGEWRKQKFRVFLKRNLHLFSLAKRVKLLMVANDVKSSGIRNLAFDLDQEDFRRSQVSPKDLLSYKQKYSEDFTRLFDICKKSSIILIPVVFPSSSQIKGVIFSENREYLDSLYGSYKLKYIDLFTRLSMNPIDSIFIKNDGHPTAFANRIVAEEIFKRLDTTGAF